MNATLALTVEPDDRESAAGFLLRSFAANRATPRQVYCWLGLTWSDGLKYEHLPALAAACKAPLAWLRPRVPQALPGEAPGGNWQWSWMGGLWRPPQSLLRRCAQVCPQCIHADGLVRLEWDLEFFCACPRHQVLLIDRCLYCQRLIRWQRPAVDVCNCQRHLRGAGQDHVVGENVLAWLRWVGESLQDRMSLVPMPERLEALFPGAPSLDGVWRVIAAFGARAATSDSPEDTAAPRSPSAVNFAMARSGLRRLAQALDGRLPANEVHVQALRRQCVKGVTESDRALAKHLLAAVGAVGHRKGRAPNDRQMELF
jgi:hypothetical protein